MERAKHYHEVRVARQFDFLIHLDSTSALSPLGDLRSAVDLRAWPTGTE
jgi:hypothetical protein